MERIARAIAMVGIALAGLAFPLAVSAEASPAAETVKIVSVADADTSDVGVLGATYGPYRDLGTCNYWMYAVRNAGYATSNCWFFLDPVTCPGGNCNYRTGWYFTQY